MLKLNKHLNKGKKQLIGGFKLPYSINGPAFMQPKWVNEEETLMVESLIGQLFVRFLREKEMFSTIRIMKMMTTRILIYLSTLTEKFMERK